MSQLSALIIYSLCLFAVALLGGWTTFLVTLNHRRLQVAISLVAGMMLGAAFFSLVPHSAENLGSIELTSSFVLLGLVSLLFLERFFCFHHHDHAENKSHCSHHPGGHASDCSVHGHALQWGSAAIGLGVCSLLDGLVLGAAVSSTSGAMESNLGRLPGLTVFVALCFHKPLDSITIAALMRVGEASQLRTLSVIAVFALIVPLGAFISFYGFGGAAGPSLSGLGVVLAISAGMFLAIALSDLIPELQFHAHDRVLLSLSLLAGLSLAWIAHSLE